MSYGLWDLLELLGSLGLFLFGMKFMSEGIQKAAGSGLRKILAYMTSNRVLGVLTGFLITIIVQSSSASTVMAVSFVNAGLLTLSQSIGVIMGANIGTTVTAWIVAAGLKVKLSALSIPLLAVAVPFLFVKNDRLKNMAEFLIGFSLLFMGLGFLKESVPDIRENPEILTFLQSFTEFGFGSILLFILVGTVLTIIIQSSSATMALTLVLLANGWIDFRIAAAMVLGENIGTTITAQLASLAANAQARRAAMAHTLFNVFGVIWMLILFEPFIHLVEIIMGYFYGQSLDLYQGTTEEVKANGMIGLSTFHTAFNITNTVLLIWTVPLIERAVKALVPADKGTERQYKLQYMESGLMSTPELAVLEAMREIGDFAKFDQKMFHYVEMMALRSKTGQKRVFDRLAKMEDESDQMEIDIAQYLGRVSESRISNETSTKIKSMWNMINDLERVADLCYNMARILERKDRLVITFSGDAEVGLRQMFKLVDRSFNQTIKYLLSEDVDKDNMMENMWQLENEINSLRDELRDEHFLRLEQGVCSTQSGLIFIDIISSCEKIGDHLVNINEATVGVK